ncbi:hypothetical protein K438DRAFT_1140262 [Mycena galopus ATCC 62051]|nr:hypothetical protein K438DRAFT_1140262 [Mycena galopus ATCC 62051]
MLCISSTRRSPNNPPPIHTTQNILAPPAAGPPSTPPICLVHLPLGFLWNSDSSSNTLLSNHACQYYSCLLTTLLDSINMGSASSMYEYRLPNILARSMARSPTWSRARHLHGSHPANSPPCLTARPVQSQVFATTFASITARYLDTLVASSGHTLHFGRPRFLLAALRSRIFTPARQPLLTRRCSPLRSRSFTPPFAPCRTIWQRRLHIAHVWCSHRTGFRIGGFFFHCFGFGLSSFLYLHLFRRFFIIILSLSSGPSRYPVLCTLHSIPHFLMIFHFQSFVFDFSTYFLGAKYVTRSPLFSEWSACVGTLFQTEVPFAVDESDGHGSSSREPHGREQVSTFH